MNWKDKIELPTDEQYNKFLNNLKQNNMKTNHFNVIKKALAHPDNDVKHLEGLRRMVQNYENIFGICNLSNLLWFKYFNIYTKLMFND